jgi:hypothetical protein
MTKENELVKLFGVNKSAIKDLRSKAPEGSWIRDISNKPEKLWGYLWSEAGVDWLKKELNVNVEPVSEKKFEAPPAEGASVERECKVSRTNFINLRLVEVIDGEDRVIAQCKDNRVIKPNMFVKVRFTDNYACVTKIISKHLNLNERK